MSPKDWEPDDDKNPIEEMARKLGKMLPDPDDPTASTPFLFAVNDEQEEKRSLYWARADRVFRLYMLMVHDLTVGGKLPSTETLDLAVQVVRMEKELGLAFIQAHGPLPSRKVAP